MSSAMNKKCAREECGKTVYPMEELKCLDKVWHKQCFKCAVCGMTLSMKNYKGYEKKPYCEPHYPKTVASAVTDTPEMRRLAENTKFQSQINYHADFEKMKGTKIEVADDPELQRHKQNARLQSQAQYHGDLDKKAQMEAHRPASELANQGGTAPTATAAPEQRKVGSIDDYDPMNNQWGTAAGGGGGAQPQAQAEKEKASPTKTSTGASSPSKASAGGGGGAKSQVSPGGAAAGAPVDRNAGFAVKALYDYTAADKDEVSFKENDIIVNCVKVDDGWMTGTVQRTLMWGMLPANYVEKINQPTGLFKLN